MEREIDLAVFSRADSATLKLEMAKRALEAAKAELEAAKQAYEEVLSSADAAGIPKAKLKKLCEDRVLALIESGMVGGLPGFIESPKRERGTNQTKGASGPRNRKTRGGKHTLEASESSPAEAEITETPVLEELEAEELSQESTEKIADSFSKA